MAPGHNWGSMLPAAGSSWVMQTRPGMQAGRQGTCAAETDPAEGLPLWHACGRIHCSVGNLLLQVPHFAMQAASRGRQTYSLPLWVWVDVCGVPVLGGVGRGGGGT